VFVTCITQMCINHGQVAQCVMQINAVMLLCVNKIQLNINRFSSVCLLLIFSCQLLLTTLELS
jgi:hypothetical protein